MHDSRFVLFRIVMLIFLSITEAATANVVERTFILESLIVLSRFPLLPDTFRDAALQCLLEHRCFRGDDRWRHQHRNVSHQIYPDRVAKKSGNSISIWTSWGLTQLSHQWLGGVRAVQYECQRANTHTCLFMIHFTIGFNYVKIPLYISKPRLIFLPQMPAFKTFLLWSKSTSWVWPILPSNLIPQLSPTAGRTRRQLRPLVLDSGGLSLPSSFIT